MRASFAAIGAVLAFYAVAALPVFAAAAVVPPEWWNIETGIALQTSVLFVGAVGASALFVGAGWANLSMLGVRTLNESVRGFGRGLALGVVMSVGALLLAVVGGSASISFEGESLMAYLQTFVSVTTLLLFAAFTEELLFRGYPISRLAVTVGKLRATLALAAVFMFAHGLNPEVSMFGLVNIALAALVLSAAFFGPGGLAAAWGLHVGWNGGLGVLADAPVSGVQFRMPIVDFATGGPVWFTGGSFGPEGGLVTTLTMTAALWWLLRNNNLKEELTK